MERIHRQEPMIPVLQLVCLMATAQLPLRPRDWDTVLTAFYQSYGYAHLATTARLCGTGILRPAAGDPKTDPKAESSGVPPPPAVPVFKFKAARKKFKLVQGTSSSGAEADDELYQVLHPLFFAELLVLQSGTDISSPSGTLRIHAPARRNCGSCRRQWCRLGRHAKDTGTVSKRLFSRCTISGGRCKKRHLARRNYWGRDFCRIGCHEKASSFQRPEIPVPDDWTVHRRKAPSWSHAGLVKRHWTPGDHL